MLASEGPISGVTLRGFATYPKIATFADVYGLKAACIAVYPMYKGLARLVGMDILDPGQTLHGQVETLKKVWNDHDFFFLHFKYTDSTGEDGNFPAQGADDREARRGGAGHPEAEAGRVHRHRRPLARRAR